MRRFAPGPLDRRPDGVGPSDLGVITPPPKNSPPALRARLVGQRRGVLEIHEPVRLQLFIETTPALLSAITKRQPAIAELVENQWVRVATIDPESGALTTLEADGRFVPFTAPAGVALPVVAESRAWYAGKEDFVPPARLFAAAGAGAAAAPQRGEDR